MRTLDRSAAASATAGSAPAEPGGSARGYVIGGIVTVLVMVVGMGGWAATTMLSGAVVAQGSVVVETAVKKVQHLGGGIVGEIRVKEGDKVIAGDLLVRLDETITRANLQIINQQIDELSLRGARLEAERDEAAEVPFPAALVPRRNDPHVQSIFATEKVIFASRTQTCNSQTSQYQERIAQLKEEIGGVTGQIDAKGREIEYIQTELKGLEALEAKRLVTMTKLVAVRREAVRLTGEHGQLRASVAQTKGKIAEIELQILSHFQERRSDIVKELREVQSKLAELKERQVAAEDQLRRVDIRAPQTGIVHQLAVHTVGGVIEAGAQIMLIVPEGDKLVIETRIAPRDIDQVRPGYDVNVRFPAFSARTTPEFKGLVARVAADLSRDEQTGQSYYLARVLLTETEHKNLGDLRLSLMPGMPAEVQIKTFERTAMSYLLKPLEDQLARTFKER